MAQVRDRTWTATSLTSYQVARPVYAVGDTLMAFHTADAGTAAAMTFSGSGWNTLVVRQDTDTPLLFTKIYWKRITAATEPTTYTFTHGPGADSVAVVASLEGTAGTAPLFLGDTDNFADPLVIVSSLTPEGAGDIALIWIGAASGSDPLMWDEPEGWTEQVDVQSGTFATGTLASKILIAGEPTGEQQFIATESLARKHWFVLTFRAGGASQVSKTGSDAVALSEQGAASALLSRTDSGAVSESAHIARLVADQATVAEARAVAAAASSADIAALAEGADVAAAPARSETAVAGDAAQVAILLDRADAAVLGETVSVGLSAADEATAGDASSKQETLGPSVSDASGLAETVSVAAELAGGDAVALAEHARVDVLRGGTDSAALLEHAQAGPAVGESAAVGETATVTVLLERSDTAGMDEAGAASQPIAASDSAALVETALVVDLGRDITGVEQPRRRWKVGAARRGWRVDPPRRGWSASSHS